MRSAFFNKLMSFLIKTEASIAEIKEAANIILVAKGTTSVLLYPITASVKFKRAINIAEIAAKI